MEEDKNTIENKPILEEDKQKIIEETEEIPKNEVVAPKAKILERPENIEELKTEETESEKPKTDIPSILEKAINTPEPEPKETNPAPQKEQTPIEKTEKKTIKTFLESLKDLRQKANLKRTEKKEQNLKKIILFAQKHGQIVNNQVERITGVGDSRATEYLNILCKKNQLIRFGKTKDTYYKPKT